VVNKRNPSICIVSPFPPPPGGMAIQAEKICQLLEKHGFDVIKVRTNSFLPKGLLWTKKIRGIRTFIGLLLFLKELNQAVSNTEVIYFLTGFFNFFFWVTYPAVIMLKLRRKHVILSARGGGAREFFRKYHTFLNPVFKRVDHITAPSGFLRDAFIKAFNIQPLIIPNIIDLSQFNFGERNPLKPNFIVTRSLEPIYNVKCVVKAFEKIHTQYPKARLGVVGDGSERIRIEELVKGLRLNNSVKFYGKVDHKKLPELYHEYDIFLNASNVDNLPGTILEAFACGLPVVSTNPGGIPYMVEDGVTGLLVPREDCDALAERALHLLENQELASTLVKNAREECEKYSPESVAKILVPLLTSIRLSNDRTED